MTNESGAMRFLPAVLFAFVAVVALLISAWLVLWVINGMSQGAQLEVEVLMLRSASAVRCHRMTTMPRQFRSERARGTVGSAHPPLRLFGGSPCGELSNCRHRGILGGFQ